VNFTDWHQRVAHDAKVRRLKVRMKRLVTKLVVQRPETFRRNKDTQIELRRVAALCLKLDVRLHYRLETEIFKGVHES